MIEKVDVSRNSKSGVLICDILKGREVFGTDDRFIECQEGRRSISYEYVSEYDQSDLLLEKILIFSFNLNDSPV
jgi:hypothetical protein